MADITTRLLAAVLQPFKEVYMFAVNSAFSTTASGDASSGDRIQLMTIPQAARLMNAHLNVSATLGASVTMKLQRDRAGVYTDLTVVTTAGGASLVTSATIGPLDLAAGDIISILVGGGNISAVATVNVDLTMQAK